MDRRDLDSLEPNLHSTIFRKRLGEILIDEGLITQEQLEEALEYQRLHGVRIGEALIALGYATEEDIAKALSKNLFIPYINLDDISPDEEALGLLPASFMERKVVLPIRKEDGKLWLAMADPLDLETIDEVRRLTGLNPEILVSSKTKILETIRRLKPKMEIRATIRELGVEPVVEEFIDAINLDTVEDRPVIVRLVENIFREAIASRATDIHIEPMRRGVKVRYRIDGVLYSGVEFSRDIYPEVLTRIKLIGKLDITEHRLPQDGHVTIITQNNEYDLRISTLPTRWGEKVVIRILDKRNAFKPLEELGFCESDMKKLLEIVNKPYGFMIVAGPTGSGKTTTLYALLEKIDLNSKNVVTIEDPIEYELEGINQTQVNEKIGYTFLTGLKHILRQDPDVILVGEIRDLETLNTSIQAALTGHLVLSTLHANDAILAVNRLRDLGADMSDLLSALIGIVSQRLVRVLCPYCRKARKFHHSESEELRILIDSKLELDEVYEPVGCRRCEYRGYRGRTAIGEVLVFDPEVAELFRRAESPHRILRWLKENRGYTTMLDDAITKLKAGITSLEEIKRVLLL